MELDAFDQQGDECCVIDCPPAGGAASHHFGEELLNILSDKAEVGAIRQLSGNVGHLPVLKRDQSARCRTRRVSSEGQQGLE